MGKIAVVTDSNSGITQAKGKELGVYVLPMPFYINDELFFEDITLTQEEFYKRLEEDADIVMSLYKLNNYKNTDLKNIMELNISENNNDKIKKIHISYIPEYCKFIDFKN